MTKKLQYAFCDVCKTTVEHPKRKTLTSHQKTVWSIVILGTLGFGIVFFLIKLAFQKKIYCDQCESKLIFKKAKLVEKRDRKARKPVKKLTPKEKILEKTSEAKPKEEKVVQIEKTEKPAKKSTKKEKEIYCPFCGEHIMISDQNFKGICPYCKSDIIHH